MHIQKGPSRVVRPTAVAPPALKEVPEEVRMARQNVIDDRFELESQLKNFLRDAQTAGVGEPLIQKLGTLVRAFQALHPQAAQEVIHLEHSRIHNV